MMQRDLDKYITIRNIYSFEIYISVYIDRLSIYKMSLNKKQDMKEENLISPGHPCIISLS